MAFLFSLCVFFVLASSSGRVSTISLLPVYSSLRDLDLSQECLTVHKFECVFVGSGTAQNYIYIVARGLGVSSLKRHKEALQNLYPDVKESSE